jgi:hypothetical protein
MSEQETSPKENVRRLTQHAMLVVWGRYAQQIGLVRALEEVKLSQKQRDHTPQTKVIEFLLAILAGLPHLQDLSRAAHPLDQDQVVADAWGQAAWADYSGVSRTLKQLTELEVKELIAAITAVSQPFIEQECERALARGGQLVYDADLTGRPVSNTSTSYPDTAYGYMGDTISLGYQAALVSMHSPTYGRLWLANHLHAGDTVSATQAQALVMAAEARTKLRPRRRAHLVAERLTQAQAVWAAAVESYEISLDQQAEAQDQVHDTQLDLAFWRREGRQLEMDYAHRGQQPTPHCKLAQARRKVATYEKRILRVEKTATVAERRVARCQRKMMAAQTERERLSHYHQQLLAENQENPHPIRACFRVDGGFASQENIAWLIEMGYDVDTKARSSRVRDKLLGATSSETCWQPVGRNASLTAWPRTTADGYFAYPVDLALARYQLGNTLRHAVLLHYGDEDVTCDLAAWFHRYNARQTIEAGIKEGKTVFQMHHLKVRSPQALLLQEHFACFAANFVRFAAVWLTQQQAASTPVETQSVKQMVQVGAHTSAWVQHVGDVWFLTFTEHSLYAGHSLLIGNDTFQLPLPLCLDIHSCHF